MLGFCRLLGLLDSGLKSRSAMLLERASLFAEEVGIMMTINELAMLILNEALVSTTSGEAFGMPECLRISYANSTAELQKAMERIRKLML